MAVRPRDLDLVKSRERLAADSGGLKGLAHHFLDPGLLTTALTHRSAGKNNNERLEFLGDAVLGLLVAEALHTRFPRASEGELTRMRAALVREETLADIARGLALGEVIRLGQGELRSGGHRRESILADAFEAVVAAIYLDAGLAAARSAILPVLESRIAELGEHGLAKDPKTRLQELLQGRGHGLPTYVLQDTAGDEHRKTFFVRCTVEPLAVFAVGEGASRRAAEAQAAALVLEQIDASERDA